LGGPLQGSALCEQRFAITSILRKTGQEDQFKSIMIAAPGAHFRICGFLGCSPPAIRSHLPVDRPIRLMEWLRHKLFLRGGGKDAYRAGSPGKGLGVLVVLDVAAVDRGLEVVERAEEA